MLLKTINLLVFKSMERIVLLQAVESFECRRFAVLADLLQRLRFDLTDALARDAERLTHFFERMADAVVQAEPHLQNLLFTLGEIDHDLSDKIAKHRTRGELGRRRITLVGDKI